MDLTHYDSLFISKENTAMCSPRKNGCIIEEHLKTQQRTLKQRSLWEMGVERGHYSGQSQLGQKVSEPQNSLCKFGLFYFNKPRWALKILGVQGSSSTSNTNDHTYLSQRDTVADYTK